MSPLTMPRSTTSASNLHRRFRCHGSHFAEHGLPEQDSEFAEEGTLLHSGLSGAKINVTAEQASLIAHAHALIGEVIASAMTDCDIAADAVFESGHERELFLRAGLRPVLIGHCDEWRYYPATKTLVIVDAKFGFIAVDAAPINLQLRAYAAMGSKTWDVETCIVGIVQPRAAMIEGAETVTMARYTREDLAAACAQILAWERLWLAPGAKRSASEEACRYCKATLICPEFAARLGPLAGDLPAGVADLDEQAFIGLFHALTAAAKDAFVDGVKTEARNRIVEGRMPGYRLKPNHARRIITQPIRAAKILAEKLHFTPDDIASVSKPTIGEVEKLYAKAAGVKAKEAKIIVGAALAEVVETKTPEPSIVEDGE